MSSAELPRAARGRAPDVFRRGGWIPMREYRDDDEVDFVIVGTGAGGGTLACRLAGAGFRVVAFDAGPFWRPLEEFASDEEEQQKLYWTEERITAGDDPIQFGSNNSGRGVGGSTVHFTMVSLRFRPEWFRSRSVLGYGKDWPISSKEMWHYYDEAERMLQISGPVSYPWGPPRGRYPRRPHPLNAPAQILARGCDALGIDWAPTPIATLSSPRGEAHPCVYRGFCIVGCSTNAKQSVLVTWIPEAVRQGAEIRDLAMVGRIETRQGRATGVHYHRNGRWHFQRARHVVVAGYSVETPRLLLNSANGEFPYGLANGNGQVGRHLMAHSNHAVWGTFDEEVRGYKAPPGLAITEHWNYDDAGKDFHGGYLFGSQGPLVQDWATTLATARGLWGMELRREMTRYNHVAGFKMVGEVEPWPENRVEVNAEADALGLPIPRITFGYSDNDRRLYRHAQRTMRSALEAAGAKDIWEHDGTAHLMGGCPMGDDPETSVTDADGRTWEIPNLWICDGCLFPTGGGVNPSLTIQALACRIGDRIRDMAASRTLDVPAGRNAGSRRAATVPLTTSSTSSTRQARHLIDRAMRIAQAERVVTCVIFPNDVQEMDAIESPPREHGVTFSGVGYVAPVIVPQQTELQRAADILNTGERVAILVGAGALEAGDEVEQVAELLGAGVAKALLGKAVLPDDLPYVTGSIGLLGTRPSDELMKNCDTLLMIGSSFPYAEFLPKEGQARGVQIDIRPRKLSLRYPMEVALCGDSVATLRALIPLLERKEDRSFRERIEASVRDWWEVLEARAMSDADPVNPQRIFWELSPRLPDDAILIADSGSSANWWARDLRIRKGMMASVSGNLATMGCGVPYAIAAKFVHPDRPVIACVGDGAMQMNGINGLITAAKYRERWSDPRLIVLVLQNLDLNQVTWEQRIMAGDPKFDGSQAVPAFDYAAYATSLGLVGVTIRSPEDIVPAIEEALSPDRPALIDAHTDPEVPPLPPHITVEMAKKYTQAMMKGNPHRWRMVKQSVKQMADTYLPHSLGRV